MTSENYLNTAMTALGMATVRDPYDQRRAKVVLQPWLVHLALEQLGERRLSIEEQKVVVAATRTPHRVKWPDWWEVRKSRSR